MLLFRLNVVWVFLYFEHSVLHRYCILVSYVLVFGRYRRAIWTFLNIYKLFPHIDWVWVPLHRVDALCRFSLLIKFSLLWWHRWFFFLFLLMYCRGASFFFLVVHYLRCLVDFLKVFVLMSFVYCMLFWVLFLAGWIKWLVCLNWVSFSFERVFREYFVNCEFKHIFDSSWYHVF